LTIEAGGRNLFHITFDGANLPGMTIGTTTGGPLLLTAGGSIQTTGSVTTTQTVNAPLVLEGNYTLGSGGTVPIIFGGHIAPAASAVSTTTTLTLTDVAGDTNYNAAGGIINGVLADNGLNKLAILRSGIDAAWTLTAANSFTGGITINNSTLRFQNNTG